MYFRHVGYKFPQIKLLRKQRFGMERRTGGDQNFAKAEHPVESGSGACTVTVLQRGVSMRLVWCHLVLIVGIAVCHRHYSFNFIRIGRATVRGATSCVHEY